MPALVSTRRCSLKRARDGLPLPSGDSIDAEPDDSLQTRPYGKHVQLTSRKDALAAFVSDDADDNNLQTWPCRKHVQLTSRKEALVAVVSDDISTSTTATTTTTTTATMTIADDNDHADTLQTQPCGKRVNLTSRKILESRKDYHLDVSATLQPRAERRHVAFVIDTSGSMRQDDVEGAESRMDAVLSAISEFLESGSRHANASATLYSLITFNKWGKALLVGGSLWDAREILGRAKSLIRPQLGTRYGKGLQLLSDAIDDLERRSTCAPSRILHVGIFLSDGKPGDHVAESTLQKMIAGLPAGALVLHTVGFGPETTSVQTHGLVRLAHIGNGSFHDNTGLPQDMCASKVGEVGLQAPSNTKDSSAMPASCTPVSKLSSFHLSQTFTKLAATIMAGTSVSGQGGLTQQTSPPLCARSSPEEAKSFEALRWVESHGVLKLSGVDSQEDKYGVENHEVLQLLHDDSLCPRHVRISEQPFARGGMRTVHQLWDSTNENVEFVAKKLSQQHDIETALDMNRNFLEMHSHARKCAENFNRDLRDCGSDFLQSRPLAVSFVDACVYFILKCKPVHGTAAGCFRAASLRVIDTCWNVEEYLPGMYEKYNDNCGGVCSIGSPAAQLAQAFSHFSYVFSDESSIITDIQGVGCRWTDPQLHSVTGNRYGKGDLGMHGIIRFFRTHSCNDFCRALHLAIPDLTQQHPDLGYGDDAVLPCPKVWVQHRTDKHLQTTFSSIPSLARVCKDLKYADKTLLPSLISSPSGDKPNCVLLGSIVKAHAGYLPVEKLARGSIVLSADGEDLCVKGLELCLGQEQELVELCTECASLTVTSSHRIMVRKGQKPQPMQARSLRTGDHVLVGGNEVEELRSVRLFRRVADIVAITLDPDDPIEFYPQPPKAILSKGEGYSKTKRGRPPCRSSKGANDEVLSTPETDYSAMHEGQRNLQG